MDDISRDALSGIERLELELIVRDFITVLNDGSENDLHAFLSEDVEYRPSPHRSVCGRPAVVAMVVDIKRTFQEWRTSMVNVAVTGDVVLAEQALRLSLPGQEPQWVMGFASFRLDSFRISAWHQIHA